MNNYPEATKGLTIAPPQIHWRLVSERVRRYHAIRITSSSDLQNISRLRSICGREAPGPGWHNKVSETFPEFECCKVCLGKVAKLEEENLKARFSSSFLTILPTQQVITTVNEAREEIREAESKLKE